MWLREGRTPIGLNAHYPHGGPWRDADEERRFFLIVMAALLVWFASAIIRLERYHYAAMLGICDRHAGELARADKEQCLQRTETRTNAFAHLAYGLDIL